MANIFIFNRQSDLSLDYSDLPDAVHLLLRMYKKKACELSFYFVTDVEIKQLHEHYFADPTDTDCIGFPIDSISGLLGDIFICPKTAICYARQHQLDAYAELLRYVIHALLHFFGFDDVCVSKSFQMRYHEDRSLKILRARNYGLSPA